MSPERNELCPCGSGKKYKKCCGSVPVEPDPIVRNRAIAYSGDTGRKRQQFCLDYAIYKNDVMSHGQQFIRDKVAAEGEAISCKKGCGKCCILYVFANLQEAECITHYLYQHEEVMQHFLSAYREWRKGLGMFYNKLPRLDQLIGRNISGKLSPQEQSRFQAEVNSYTVCRVPCPFLIDDACSIYEVRPFVCASLVSTSPTEECQWDNPETNRATYYRFGFNMESDFPYFIKPRSSIVFGCMPELVHRIIEDGYSFLSTIEGLESLRR